MMIGNLPPFGEPKAKNIGATPDESHLAEMEKMKAEIKWMKWALILLIAYILYKETK
jgi:hypothetical protein